MENKIPTVEEQLKESKKFGIVSIATFPVWGPLVGLLMGGVSVPLIALGYLGYGLYKDSKEHKKLQEERKQQEQQLQQQ